MAGVHHHRHPHRAGAVSIVPPAAGGPIPERKRPTFVPGAVFAAVIVLIAGELVLRAKRTAVPAAPRSCETAIVTRGALAGILRLPGVLRATGLVRVGSEGFGRVVEVDVAPGERVAAGQILARLDSEAQRAGFNGAAAQVAEATVVEVKAQRSLRAILNDFHAEGALPEDWPADHLLDGEAGDAQLDVLQASARSRRRLADLQLARSILAKRTIRSPMSGVVLSRAIDPGETIGASPPAPPLFIIGSDTNELRLDVQVDERYVTSLRPGEAEFTTPALGREELSATIREIVPLADAVSSPASYTLVLSVPNPKGRLHVGMSALVELPATAPSDALAVPQAAVEFGASDGLMGSANGPHQRGQAASIWLAGEGGHPYKKAVEVGVQDADLVELRGFALEPGMVAIADRSPTSCLVRAPISPYGSGKP